MHDGISDRTLVWCFHSKRRGSSTKPTNVWRRFTTNWESRRWVTLVRLIRSDEDLKNCLSPSPPLLLLLSALSRHHRRPPQHRPEYRVQVLHGGPQHPHPHSQQQQLQRDVGVHARPQSRADAGKQTRSLIGGLWRVPTGPTGSSFTGRNDLRCTKITFYFFYVPFHVFWRNSNTSHA